MINVLLIAIKDWANTGYELAASLRSVGVDALCVSKIPHTRYGFDPAPKIYKSQAELSSLASKADIIIFLHSDRTYTGVEKQYDKKGIVVFHGGSVYRRNSEIKNIEFYNKVGVDLTLIQTADLLGLPGSLPEKEVWLLPPINTDKLQPNYNKKYPGKRLVAHYPSSSAKGTELFNKLINKLNKTSKFRNLFIYETGQVVNYKQNIKRVSECDIYFECFKPLQHDKVLCEWGMAALEAASMGKVVLTNFLSSDKYINEYGLHTIQVANDLETLESQLVRLIGMGSREFNQLQKDTRDWVVKHHSYKAVGERLLKIFYERLDWEGK